MKHLVDVDEDALADARDHLGTTTIKETVNAALRRATGHDADGPDIDTALDVLANAEFEDRERAWR